MEMSGHLDPGLLPSRRGLLGRKALALLHPDLHQIPARDELGAGVMQLLNRHRESEHLTSPSARSKSRYDSLALLAVLAFGIITLVGTIYCAPLPQIVLGHDIFLLLDGAQKWQFGIVPHKDYYSPFGPVAYALVFMGAKMSGSMKFAYPAAVCIAGLLTLFAGTYIAFTRMSRGLACVTVLFLFGVAIAPEPLRFPTYCWTYACIYNRWGYALIGLLILLAARAPFRDEKWLHWCDGSLTGFCLANLLFLKISYGLLAIFTLAGLCVLYPRRKEFYLSLALGTMATSAFWLTCIGWDIKDMLVDLAIAKKSRTGIDTSEFLLNTSQSLGTVLLCSSGILALVGTQISLGKPPFNLEIGRITLAFVGLVFLAILIVVTNCPLGIQVEMPILGLVALLFAQKSLDLFNDASPGRPRLDLRTGLWPGAAIIVALSVAGPIARENYSSLALAINFFHRGVHLPARETLQNGPLAGFQFNGYGGDPIMPTTYAGKLEAGLGLLRRTGNLGKPVIAVDFTNPFNALQGIKPPVGSPTSWQLGYSFASDAAPPPSSVFKGAEVILWAKIFGDGNAKNLVVLDQLYGDWVREHYEFRGETTLWRIYQLKGSASN